MKLDSLQTQKYFIPTQIYFKIAAKFQLSKQTILLLSK